MTALPLTDRSLMSVCLMSHRNRDFTLHNAESLCAEAWRAVMAIWVRTHSMPALSYTQALTLLWRMLPKEMVNQESYFARSPPSFTPLRSSRGRGYGPTTSTFGRPWHFEPQQVNRGRGRQRFYHTQNSGEENGSFQPYVNIHHRAIYERKGEPTPDFKDPVVIRTMLLQQNAPPNTGLTMLLQQNAPPNMGSLPELDFNLPDLPPLSPSNESAVVQPEENNNHKEDNATLKCDMENLSITVEGDIKYRTLLGQFRTLQDRVRRLQLAHSAEGHP
uniref:'chromo' domain containing protein n=1 Tax=Steinernema glaseri TaxID=37863 RepID=A0A1I7ZLJ8_9BILA